jgi:aminobenzoyl-glutamate utilization protein B
MSKEKLYDFIDKKEEDLKEISKKIWDNPEGPFVEKFASDLQKEYLEKEGFKIKEVENVDTAFIAEYGSGKPVLGVLGEYDALPGLSQEVAGVKKQIEGQKYGHGCGHNLLGTAGVGAVLAIKELIDQGKIKGTVRYFGCPAEETLAGKVKMAKYNAFDGLDACLTWHPASLNTVWGCSFLAMNNIKFRFHGIAAHAAAAPDSGRSALDGVELMNVGSNYLREHINEKARVHYVITNGGGSPNTVPEFAEVWYYVRAPERSQVEEIYNSLINIAKGAALMTETKMEYELVAGCYNVLPNQTLGKVMNDNMKTIGGPKFTEDDFKLAEELQKSSTREQKKKVMSVYFAPDELLDKTLMEEVTEVDDSGKIIAGSTDVGDVSFLTPLAQITAATWPVGTAAHSWQATAASGSGIGMNAMIFVSKVIAGSLYDIYTDQEILEKAKEEFKDSTSDFEYVSPLE